MLVDIRKNLRGWFSYLLVALIAVVFVFFGISSYLITNPEQEPVAEVNGEGIPYRTFRVAYQQALFAREQYQQEKGKDFEIDDKVIRQEVLDDLIKEKINKEAAIARGFGVSKQQVDTEILRIPQFYEQGKFSEQKFVQYASNIAETPNGLRARIKDNLLLSQLPVGLVQSTFLTNQEVKRLFALLEQKRDIGYGILPVANFHKQLTVSEDEVKEYYNTHLEEFMQPEKVKLEYLALSPEEIGKQVMPTEEELQAYYDDHQEQYKTERFIRVSHILLTDDAKTSQKKEDKAKLVEQKLAKSVSFETLVNDYSDDVASKKSNGDLGWMSMPKEKSKQNTPFNQAAFGLKKVGEVAGPIETRYGLQFIKLTENKPRTTAKFADVKQDILKNLTERASQKKFAEYKEILAADTFENPETLSIAAENLDLKIKTTPLVSRLSEAPGITQERQVMQAAFSEDVLLDGNNSGLITMPDGSVVVIRVSQHVKPKQSTLAEVKDEITSVLIQLKAADKVKEQGDLFVSKLKAGESAETLAKVAGIEWQLNAELRRNSNNVPREILPKVFKMSKPTDDKKPTVAGFRLSNGDYAVISLKAVYPGQLEEKDPVFTTMKEQLSRLLGQSNYTIYSDAEREMAEVKLNLQNIRE